MMKIIIISGPTASGKSLLAESLSIELADAVIINADSMQVYKDLPTLSAQPKISVSINKYSLYSIMNFYEHCSVGIWAELANKQISQINSAGKLPVIVGGSGLYIKALIDGIGAIPNITTEIKTFVIEHFAKLGRIKFYDELMRDDIKLQGKIHANDTYRMQRAMQVLKQTGRSITSFENTKPNYNYLHVFLNPDRKILYQNCNARFIQMLQSGAIEEAKELFKKIQNTPGNGYNVENTLGYKSIIKYMLGQLSLEQTIAEAQQLTRNYAKRQVTWFNNKFQNKAVISYGEQDNKAPFTQLLKLVKEFLK